MDLKKALIFVLVIFVLIGINSKSYAASSFKADSIQATNSASGTDQAGTSLTLSGGRGTGAGTAGDIVLKTSDVLSTGTTRQSLTTKATLKATGLLGINTTSPTTYLDANSPTLRLRITRTPATAGAAGNTGDICWDPNYIYMCVGTNTWKRTGMLHTW